MSLVIGVPRETAPGERRVAVFPDVVRKYIALGAEVCIETGAGDGSYFHDKDFNTACIVESIAEVFERSQVILKVQPPAPYEIKRMKPGSAVIGFLAPFDSIERAQLLCERNVTSFAVELIPRISRAQSMDALSSQATVSGYLCALIAAENSSKFFPMITSAAGTLRPARVLVIGAGVAGLQAMATAHRLGAVVEAYDVRPETREHAESVGARFIETGVSASGMGGYARELTVDEKKLQQEKLAKAVTQTDVLITTAALLGKRSPLIITEEMVRSMMRGAIIVDMAAEGGGNVAGTRPGETVQIGDVTIFGPVNLPSRMPVHASEMYSKNLYNFLVPLINDGELKLDWNDEVVAGSAFTHEGTIRNEGVRKALEGQKSS